MSAASGKRILVTGGRGMIGACVVRQLVDAGDEVTVFDLNPAGSESEAVHSVVGDVTDREALVAALKEHGIERIVHMAAIVAGAQENPGAAFSVNVGGTLAVLEAADASDINRVVCISSRAVYGDILGAEERGSAPRISESHPVNPISIYDVTKVAAEGIGRNYRRDHGVEFVALRYASIYGPGKDVRSHGGFGNLSRTVEDPVHGRAVRIERGGDQVDDIIYVEDAAQGAVLAVSVDAVPETAYHISTGEGHTIRDLAATVESLIPDADIEVGPGLDFIGAGVDYYAVLDNDRARRDLGYVPRFDLRQGVIDYAERLGATDRLELGGSTSSGAEDQAR